MSYLEEKGYTKTYGEACTKCGNPRTWRVAWESGMGKHNSFMHIFGCFNCLYYKDV